MDWETKAGPPDIDSVTHALPKVGMVFQSEEHAYDFYNQYAKTVGFSVRRDSSSVNRSDGTVIRRVLCCSKQGFHTKIGLSARTGCEARIIIKRRGGNFLLTVVNETHNHELVAPSEVHRLRSQRKFEDSQARNMYHSGIGPVDDISTHWCKIDDCTYPMVIDGQPSSRSGDSVGTSMVVDCHPSTPQRNDLAHLALTIVAKGNSSAKSVIYTRKLLARVHEELDNFLKSDCDKTKLLDDTGNVSQAKAGEGNMGGNLNIGDPSRKKSNGKVSRNMKGTSEKGKGKKRFQKKPTGSYSQVSDGVIGTTLLMLQQSSVLPTQHNNQVSPKQKVKKELVSYDAQFKSFVHSHTSCPGMVLPNGIKIKGISDGDIKLGINTKLS
ncbi:hypothetical protein IFM89_028346 [Coptis chinensis]|uniref:FAR1 domain-containing protein n=1 Tax=Coptis chinensis TaxID=261450 RepID=A0A835IF80_9MAGN|nr:hypothetical protein IFM89_028346 [Coptis chinensis]